MSCGCHEMSNSFRVDTAFIAIHADLRQAATSLRRFLCVSGGGEGGGVGGGG
jgi:hypothetical protein